MDLSIRSLRFTNFRSYESLALNDLGSLTIFVGPNAVGKTNIVEGIQLLTAQTSFRHPTVEQLVRHGQPFARLSAEVSDGDRLLSFEVQMGEGKKRHLLNGKTKRTADLKGVMPSVVFTPDDLELAKGASGVRRNAVDALGAQLTSNHYVIRRDYEKVVRSKNRLLRDGAPDDLVESLDELVVTVGAQLVWYRTTLFRKLAAKTAEFYEAIAQGGEHLGAAYVPSWEASGAHGAPEAGSEPVVVERDEAREHLAAGLITRRAEERARSRAVVGPHADHLEFYIDGKPVGAYGSQGQQRSLVLALKLAEVEVIRDVLGQRPAFLLDDVMSELDESRRRALVDLVSDDVQTFITTANLAYFDAAMLGRARIIELDPRNKGVLRLPEE